MKNNDNRLTKHLYVHIPFCKNICTYCDFCRLKITSEDQRITKYLNLLINKIRQTSKLNQYQTIYIGGGTPNFLTGQQLNSLLSCLQPYIDCSVFYEFTIECNPELITEPQVQLFKKYHINRISLGVQTLNNHILQALNRTHNNQQVEQAVALLHKYQIMNISCDFIYAIKDLTLQDLAASIKFALSKHIPHLSFYALEIKEGSQLNKEHYQVNLDTEGEHLDYLEKNLAENGYQRYEVSNWVKDANFESQHNKAYWLSEDWKGLGWGAHGYEQHTIYNYQGELLDWKLEQTRLQKADVYFQILMMGLRLVKGIDIVHNKQNRLAYKYYQNRLINCEIVNDHLKAKNLDLLHDILLNLID